jgi:gamma-glutamyl-gamma-aminobutyrate hydrolase PuuD
MATPAVGLTWSDDLVDRSSSPGENALKYMALLVDAGLNPVLITPSTRPAILSALDGLLLPGGPDIAPAVYGHQPDGRLGPVVPELDALELEMFHAARDRGRPVLGICRGQQLVNVALGGTLFQHIDHPQWDEDDPGAPVHEVRLVAGSHLRRVLGVDTAVVNSGHHQAVDALAPSLTAVAHSADGCVEALESGALLVMSVQWHPDEMRSDDTSRRLLAGFAQWMGAS